MRGNLDETVHKFKYLCDYNNYGSFDDYKKRTIKTEKLKNEWRKLTFETLNDSLLLENAESNIERERVIKLIQNNEFEINNYQSFFDATHKSNRKEMLTNYSPSDYEKDGTTTFLLKGYDIGYAIKKDGDIISVFNNSGVPKIGDELMRSAIRNKGEKLDHFDGYLSDFYEKLGFKETGRMQWDDQYSPANWDYEKYGRPDVVMRKYVENEN
jgi:hypothetical protein